MDSNEIKRYIIDKTTKDIIIKSRVTLIIGEAVKYFKSMYRGEIISITTSEEVKDFIDNYSCYSDTPLVFEDISLMNSLVQTYLLKYIEETCRPLIILASSDNIISTIISRCRNIIKIPKIIDYSFVDIDKFMEEHSDVLQSNYILPELKYESAMNCPEYYYRYIKMKISNHEDKNANQIIKYII